jgi:hypothetical protein
MVQGFKALPFRAFTTTPATPRRKPQLHDGPSKIRVQQTQKKRPDPKIVARFPFVFR